MTQALLEMRGITKEFPGVKALSGVDLTVTAGSIHAICGENGAGKSTLMKVLSGVYPHGSYDGEIFFDGRLCEFKDIRGSERCGIAIIHQELALVPYLSIAENVFLGNELSTRGVIGWDRTLTEAQALLDRVGLHESPQTRVADIGVGKQQLVEIAKALSKDVRLLILDEPTAALNDSDSRHLLELISDLRDHGITSIIISHKLNEVMQIADTVTILRDGHTIETIEVNEELTEDRIVRGMVGRDLTHRFPPRGDHEIGEVVFAVANWTVLHPIDQQRKVVDDVSLNVRAGEIVGIAGLMGAGRTELAMSVFGRSYGRYVSGKVFKGDREVSTKTVSDAIRNGIAYATEDRKHLGLNLMDGIAQSITLPSLRKVSTRSVIDHHREVVVGERFRSSMRIKASSVSAVTGKLSGGNQQKVVLSKWLFTDPDVLILDEPTRGIDVGAKYEIYTIINDLASRGKAVIVISSELPELLGLCDRIYTLSQGRMTGEVARADATQETLMRYMMKGRV
ncbi:ATP-binding cassette domain-containing protein [Mycolicibacterium goodii]|uniref:ATP-binding cassette domain-containing protein n=2 Tax=Mycolicibacterium goodii TaxID=134601 RepID=A0ABS6HH01_MYCGD|nr:ATP-binding cassette domain-containing protein [Mycolicibacterium goodii]OKH72255.1 ABC transporter ATP-binding protein [Mycobacterium sp. SWH-M5]MBU8818396.1 ATP-binding cassette domain-containing protein [Mycolicibacterium goodii]MBU8821969.1 ATP-binding cassette domain-containing protein [Mycolicibacterium goodii]MBU8828463.1 ATP-binding cassette domain-containing protein [Mycolicibacterium goodii]